MRKKFYNIALLIAMTSCNTVSTEGEQEVKKGSDTLTTVKISVNGEADKKVVFNENAFFEARGFEPGWYVEFSKSRMRLLLDYGKDSVILYDEFEEVRFKDDYSYENNDLKLAIQIQNKTCIADGSGDTLSKAVKVNLKNKTYKGCGKFTSK